MSASAATRLRQLATQYHGGELDLQSYRILRAELLDRLTNSDAVGAPDEVSTTLPQRTRPAVTSPAPTPVPPPTAIPQAPKVQPAAAAQPAPVVHPPVPPSKGGAGNFIVVGLIAAVALGAAWYFYLRPVPQAGAVESAQADTTSESYQAINDFLAADDWSDEQIAYFNTRWATLPDEMRAAALDQAWYQNFVEKVRSRVKEQRAMTATAESAGTVDGPLAALASSVAIDVSSPDAVAPPREHHASMGSEASKDAPTESGSGATVQTVANVPPPSAAPATPIAPAKAVPTSASTSQPGKAASTTAANAKVVAPQNSPDTSPDRCRIELVGSRKPRCRDALNIGGFGPYLAVVSKGEFQMGSKQVAQEQPVHAVRIAKSFAIAEFEVSQAEYRLFCTETKRTCEAQPWTGDDLPVVRVNWQDARDYVAWLSRVSGKTYRLATEAEWEFAARSGGTALYPSGDALAQTDAVFSHTDKQTAPWPRSRKINANTSGANTFKLYHSIGNVREWVEDAWSASFAGAPDDGSARKSTDSVLRVVRGGAYSDTAPKLRFTTREGIDPTTRDATTGFRVVREL